MKAGIRYRGLDPRAIGEVSMQIFSVRRVLPALLAVVLVFAFSHAAEAGDTQEVNVYSYRQPYLIDPLFKKFTQETGIKVNVIFAEKGLIERMAAEGRNSPADLLLTVDVGNLMQAKEARVGQVVHSQALKKRSLPPIATERPCGGGSRAAPASSWTPCCRTKRSRSRRSGRTPPP